eukprot:7621117-Pyramimonas_sp.AAC.1
MDCSGSSGTSSSSKGQGKMPLANLSPTSKPQDLTRAAWARRKLDCVVRGAAVGPGPEGPVGVTTKLACPRVREAVLVQPALRPVAPRDDGPEGPLM